MAELQILERTARGYVPNAAAIRTLQDAVNDPRCAELPVAVISVAGAMRTGKSTLLNIFLMALGWMEQGRSLDDPNWIRADNFTDGFHWRSGANQDTTGILVWSRPFVVLNRRGRRIAVVLVDTQGSFDASMDMNDSAAVFAFSTLLASTQIFNLRSNIDESVLEYLDVFTQFGRHVVNRSAVYQNMVLLVRDWCLTEEFSFTGGDELLQSKMKPPTPLPAEQQAIRNRIQSAYEHVRCFLMPIPGTKAMRGVWDKTDVPSTFWNNAEQLILHSLEHVKTMNGQILTCSQLVDITTPLMEVFDRERTPALVSMFEAMRDSNNRLILENAINAYRTVFLEDVNEVGPDEADNQSRQVALMQLLDGLIDESNMREQLITELNSALNNIVTDSKREIERHNANLIDAAFESFTDEMDQQTQSTAVEQCFPSCKAKAFEQLDDVLRGGPTYRTQAIEKLETRMEAKRRLLAVLQEQRRQCAEAEKLRVRAEERYRQANEARKAAELKAVNESKERERIYRESLAAAQTAQRTFMEAQRMETERRVAAERRADEAQRRMRDSSPDDSCTIL